MALQLDKRLNDYRHYMYNKQWMITGNTQYREYALQAKLIERKLYQLTNTTYDNAAWLQRLASGECLEVKRIVCVSAAIAFRSIKNRLFLS